MRKLLARIGAILVLTTLTSHGQSQQSITFDQSGNTSLWFVELLSPPGIDGTPAGALEREEAAFHAAAQSAGIVYRKSRHFRDLFNGLTVRAAASDVNKLRALPGGASRVSGDEDHEDRSRWAARH
jgi:hypothetical protein